MTGRIEKTVFISYRRTNMPWALAIFQNLKNEGFDVFFDYLSIPSGDFENIIIENIKARAHFIVILTPSALEKCIEPGDWLRREIETAMDEERNIVPLMLENFDFGSPSTTQALSGKLEKLKKYNGLRLYAEYFFDGMNRLREQYLNVSLDAVVHPISESAKPVTEEQQIAASEVNHVGQEELTAQKWFERGYLLALSKNFDEAIKSYTKAIQLDPNNPYYYLNRGTSKGNVTEYDEAIADINQSIDLNPDFAEAYYCRGLVHGKRDNFTKAIEDFNKAILLKPDYSDAFYSRGLVYGKEGKYNMAIPDFDEAILLKPDYADAFYSRGITYTHNNKSDNAIADFDEAIRLKTDFADAYWARGNAWFVKEDFDSAIADYQKYFDLGGTDERVKKYLDNAQKKIGNNREN